MGYYSTIYIKCKWESAPKLVPVLQKHDLRWEQCEDEDYLYLIMYDLKWYDRYQDVQEINSVIESLDKDCGMVRVGEESNDIEEYGDCGSVDLYYRTYTEVDIDGTSGTSIMSQKYPELLI